MRIRETAYAKINIALDVTGRSGGLHELDMLMQTVSLADELSFGDGDGLSLTVEGQDPCPGDPGDNLVMRAAAALAREAGITPGARIGLIKRIPAQAGFGGGSSDCAAALRGLSALWGLRVPREDMLRIALSLGSDVPYFLTGGFARVSGTGGIVEPLPPLPRMGCLLITPRPGLSTALVFGAYDGMAGNEKRSDLSRAAKLLRQGDAEGAYRATHNALEAPALALAPHVGEALRVLRGTGSPFVRMSGSGTGVYALFSTEGEAEKAAHRAPGSLAARFTG